MFTAFVTDKAEVLEVIEQAKEAALAGELPSFAIRAYLKDGTFRDFTWGETEEAEALAVKQLLAQVGELRQQ